MEKNTGTYVVMSREFPPQDGGIAVAAYQMASHLARMGRRVCVLTWADPAATREDYPFELVRIRKVQRRFLQIVFLFATLVGIYRKHRIKKIFCLSWNFSGVACALFSICFGTPYLLWVIGYEVSPLAIRGMDRRLMRFALRHAKKIIAISHFTASLLSRHEKRLPAAQVIPLGVDPDQFHPQVDATPVGRRHGLEGKKVLLSVARLWPRKGHDKILEALPRVLENIPNLVYLIVGKGGEEQNLRTQSRDLQLEKHVIFAGFIPDRELPAYYGACDVFILANREITDDKDPWAGDFEGLGIAFLEASAAGKPVIAGRSGGAADAVVDSVTGILVDPCNVTQIARAVTDLLQDTQKARQMGQAGRRRVEESLNWPRVVERCEALFTS